MTDILRVHSAHITARKFRVQSAVTGTFCVEFACSSQCSAALWLSATVQRHVHAHVDHVNVRICVCCLSLHVIDWCTLPSAPTLWPCTEKLVEGWSCCHYCLSLSIRAFFTKGFLTHFLTDFFTGERDCTITEFYCLLLLLWKGVAISACDKCYLLSLFVTGTLPQ